MSNLAERLVWLGFVPDLDFFVQDDGDGAYIANWLSPKPQPDATDIEQASPGVSHLSAHGAQKRWEKETGGITVSGMDVHTDDRSKSLIIGARMAAEADPDFTTRWKAADGSFVTIDAPTIIAISDAVLAHVQACFSIEDQVLSDIEAGIITTTAEVDAAFA